MFALILMKAIQDFRSLYNRAKANFYWPELKQDVKQLVRNCDTCQRNKPSYTFSMGLLQPLLVPQDVWVDLSIDFIECLPLSKGYSVIMVVVDRLSKYSHSMPLKHSFTVVIVALTFFDNVFKLHVMQASIIIDIGSTFVSSFWK